MRNCRPVFNSDYSCYGTRGWEGPARPAVTLISYRTKILNPIQGRVWLKISTRVCRQLSVFKISTSEVVDVFGIPLFNNSWHFFGSVISEFVNTKFVRFSGIRIVLLNFFSILLKDSLVLLEFGFSFVVSSMLNYEFLICRINIVFFWEEVHRGA